MNDSKVVNYRVGNNQSLELLLSIVETFAVINGINPESVCDKFTSTLLNEVSHQANGLKNVNECTEDILIYLKDEYKENELFYGYFERNLEYFTELFIIVIESLVLEFSYLDLRFDYEIKLNTRTGTNLVVSFMTKK